MTEPEDRFEPPPGEPPKVLTGDLKRHFLTGLLVLTPVVVAAWVLYRLFTWIDGLLWEQFRFPELWPGSGGIPGVGVVAVIALVILVGLLVNNYVGRRIYALWESLIIRIPLFNKIYLAVKQIGEALFAADKTVFRAVGMIEYPRPGLWALVFVTEPPGEEVQRVAGDRVRSVFLPTTPNPTSGFLLMVPENQIHFLKMSVEDGLKMVVSGGAYVPGRVNPDAYPLAARRPREKKRWWQRRGKRKGAGKDESAA